MAATQLFSLLDKYKKEEKAAKKERLAAMAGGAKSSKPYFVKCGINHVTKLVESNAIMRQQNPRNEHPHFNFERDPKSNKTHALVFIGLLCHGIFWGALMTKSAHHLLKSNTTPF